MGMSSTRTPRFRSKRAAMEARSELMYRLAAYLTGLKSGSTSATSDSQQHQVMLDMVSKYLAQLTQHKPSSSKTPAGLVVVLTGATGSLGAHILHCLLQVPEVRKVVCLSRAKSHDDSLVRLKDSLIARKLSVDSHDMARVESYASEYSDAKLGLGDETFEILRQEVTHVLHVSCWTGLANRRTPGRSTSTFRLNRSTRISWAL